MMKRGIAIVTMSILVLSVGACMEGDLAEFLSNLGLTVDINVNTNGGDGGVDENGNDNDNSNGNTNDNDNENDNGNGNTNDNDNMNDNGEDCSDGVFRVEANLTGDGVQNGEIEYRLFPSGCERFVVHVEDFEPGTYDVTIESVVVAEILVESDGKGRLEFRTDNGEFPEGFPEVLVGNVVDVGELASGELALECSEDDSCDGNDNSNDNAGDDDNINGNNDVDNVNDNGDVDVNGNGNVNGNINDNGNDNAGNSNGNSNGNANGA